MTTTQNRIDIGEPTEEAANFTDNQLSAVLQGTNTQSLDAAAQKAYDNYLKKWANEIVNTPSPPQNS